MVDQRSTHLTGGDPPVQQRAVSAGAEDDKQSGVDTASAAPPAAQSPPRFEAAPPQPEQRQSGPISQGTADAEELGARRAASPRLRMRLWRTSDVSAAMFTGELKALAVATAGTLAAIMSHEGADVVCRVPRRGARGA